MKRMFHKAQPSFVSLRTINNRYGKSTAKTTVTETKDGFNPSKYENLLILETVYRSRNTTYPVHEITATEKGNIPAGYAAATAEASDATVLVNIGDPDGAPAVHNSLAMKGEDGKVYDITVATGGTLKATERA